MHECCWAHTISANLSAMPPFVAVTVRCRHHVRALLGHSARITAVAFSPDGRYAAAACALTRRRVSTAPVLRLCCVLHVSLPWFGGCLLTVRATVFERVPLCFPGDSMRRRGVGVGSECYRV